LKINGLQIRAGGDSHPNAPAGADLQSVSSISLSYFFPVAIQIFFGLFFA
jgi:hypothetical protein